MSTKKSNQKKTVAEVTVVEQPAQNVQIDRIETDSIVPNPANPRKYFSDESLTELAQNIIEHGVLQPVTVREVESEGGKKYEIIFGERRFRAARLAGVKTLPCMVRVLDDEAAFDLMVSENLQRQDMRPSEEAAAFKKIVDKGNSVAYISERFGKSESFIHNRLSLVRLIPEIAGLLDSEEIPVGMGVEISKLEPDIQTGLFREHLDAGLTVNNWRTLPLKVFKEKLETNYTVLLSRFAFDKSECEQCPYNSELRSLFPVMENSRCTRTACLLKKQESYMVESILSAVGKENVDVYVNNSGGVFNEAVTTLKELGIEVKTGRVYPMPENPDMPSEDDFADDQTGYEQAQKDFLSKQTKWNTLQSLIENGAARKVILLENLIPEFGYIMVERQNPADSAVNDHKSHNDHTGNLPANGESVQNSGKPDLMTVLLLKDKKNREAALCNMIEDTKKLIGDTDIPPAELSPFEEALIFFVMLPDLNRQHFELFGIPEGREISEDDMFGLYNSLTETQKNVLKRDFMIKNMINTSGICKKSALLLELCKYYFPDETAEMENAQNEKYQKQKEVIQDQMVKIKAKTEQMQETA